MGNSIFRGLVVIKYLCDKPQNYILVAPKDGCMYGVIDTLELKPKSVSG